MHVYFVQNDQISKIFKKRLQIHEKYVIIYMYKRGRVAPLNCMKDVEGFTMAEISVQFKNKING